MSLDTSANSSRLLAVDVKYPICDSVWTESWEPESVSNTKCSCYSEAGITIQFDKRSGFIFSIQGHTPRFIILSFFNYQWTNFVIYIWHSCLYREIFLLGPLHTMQVVQSNQKLCNTWRVSNPLCIMEKVKQYWLLCNWWTCSSCYSYLIRIVWLLLASNNLNYIYALLPPTVVRMGGYTLTNRLSYRLATDAGGRFSTL